LLGSINSRRKDVPTAPYGTVVELPGTGVSDTRAFAEARFDHDFDSGANFTARGYYDATRFVGNYLQPAPLGMEVDTGGADRGGPTGAGSRRATAPPRSSSSGSRSAPSSSTSSASIRR